MVGRVLGLVGGLGGGLVDALGGGLADAFGGGFGGALADGGFQDVKGSKCVSAS